MGVEVAKQIAKRRRQCLVHRYIYYVRGENLIDDPTYDLWERELRALVTAHPDIAAATVYDDDCPSRHVGSSNLWDYPREIQHLGDSLLKYNPENFDWWVKVTSPQEETSEPENNTGNGPNLDTGRLF